MPHSREVHSTPHDRHDPMLVAALAAGDLAGTDRDQAISLTRTCPDCAGLHDDLLALARATAAAPPPVATRPRDFRLTPADVARLRPSGWRRFVTAISRTPSALSRPMGVGLATLGLVGLLVGNVQLGATTSSGTPAAAASGATSGNAPQYFDMLPLPSGVDAAAGGAPGRVTAVGSGDPATVASPEFLGAVPIPAASSAGPAVAALPVDKSASAAPVSGAAGASRDTVASDAPARPLNLLFGASVVIGITLLVAARFRSRRGA